LRMLEPREFIEQWMHTHSPNKPKKFKKNIVLKKLRMVIHKEGVEC
jgi:hypothetical protein